MVPLFRMCASRGGESAKAHIKVRQARLLSCQVRGVIVSEFGSEAVEWLRRPDSDSLCGWLCEREGGPRTRFAIGASECRCAR